MSFELPNREIESQSEESLHQNNKPIRAVIRRVSIRNFRSFGQAEFQVENPLYLVGRNGAGKSNLLDAFAFLADAMVLPLLAVFDVRGGINNVRHRTPGGGSPRNLRLGLEVRSPGPQGLVYRYGFEVHGEKNFGYKVVREQCVVYKKTGTTLRRSGHFIRIKERLYSTYEGMAMAAEPESLILPLAGSLSTFAPLVSAIRGMKVYGVHPHGIRELQDPDAGTSLKSDATNAASVLQEIASRAPRDFRTISELLAAAVPQTRVSKPIRHGKKLSLEFVQEWQHKRLKFEAYNMSDGTLRVLGMLLAVYQRQVPTLIGIEEPEVSLHPGAVGVLLDVLDIAARRSQVVVTTQSPEVLDSKNIRESNIRVVEWTNGASQVISLSHVPREALNLHLMGAGELLRSNQLSGQQEPYSPSKVFVDI